MMTTSFSASIGGILNVPTKTGDEDRNGDSGSVQAQVKANKKQVSFNRYNELVMIQDLNITPASSIMNSTRSMDSIASKDSAVGPSPSSSSRSYDSSGYTSVSIPSLHSSLMRTQKHRDPYRYYEVLKVLGDGSMGSVSKVKKRKSAIGGSARKEFVEKERLETKKTLFQHCFSFCIPGSKENKKEHLFVSVKDGEIACKSNKSREDSGTISALTGDSSYRDAGAGENGSVASSPVSQVGSKRRTFKKSSSLISYSGESNAVYALKTIILDKVTDATFRKELLNEISILRSIDHPNIVKAIETYDYQNRLYLVLELCSGGDLYARDPYSEQQAKAITYMMLDAVAYLHAKNLVHRDLKYENVCFCSPTSSSIKIIDFGLSKKYMKEGSMNETVGTVYTMAPEVIKGEYDEACDVWSIGVMTFMLLSSSLPFYGKSRSHVVRKILQNKYGFKGKRWKTISPQAIDFVKSLLVHDVKLRPTAVEAMRDPWFENEFGSNDYLEIISSSVMDRVQASIETFAGYSRLKKLSLMVIAHKSTDEEIGFLRRLFLRRFDVKKSTPDISYPEFKEALADYNYTDEDMVRMFFGMDIDGTGKVSYSEFLAATIEAHGTIAEERIAEAFDRLDEDDTGYVTVDNLRSFLGEDISDEFIDEIIDEVDIVRDHRISYEEFLSLWGEDDDEMLRRNLQEVESRRTKRDSILSPEAHASFDSFDTSSYSNDSADGEPSHEYFAREKEKSLRGVWI
ncbi:protein kinase family protein [Nitzschia inconspicua]|uniref:Protein kinase family protein n=1 Tax=Nitzschia inconspicua TaxID=303405 RepID=A0A9K3PTK8_9STRA|nr:protein kinase family protein [Nitzschia inconspicua]